MEAANPREASLAMKCELALVDVGKRTEDLDAVARDILGAELALGILFFDGTSIDVALGSLRALVSDVDQAIERFRAE